MRGATRANVAGQIGNDSVQLSQHFQLASDRDRVSPAESAFLVPCDNAMMMMMIGTSNERETRFSGICKIARGAC